jgi:SAM-dependent methyltransferase
MPGSGAFPDHFSAVAAQYAAHRPDYPRALFDWLADAAPSTRAAWDCGTGSGQAAVGLARRFESVFATDASAEQVARARRHRRVAYRAAPAESSGLPAGSVDCVTVAQALHWFDRERFWAEARRVLVPGGVLAAWCYLLFRVDAAVDAVVGRFYGDVVGPYWPPERALVEKGYATIAFPFEELPAPRFRMVKRWTLSQLEGYLTTWSAVRGYVAARGEDPLAALRPELSAAWGGPARVRRVVWDLEVRAGRNPGARP